MTGLVPILILIPNPRIFDKSSPFQSEEFDRNSITRKWLLRQWFEVGNGSKLPFAILFNRQHLTIRCSFREWQSHRPWLLRTALRRQPPWVTFLPRRKRKQHPQAMATPSARFRKANHGVGVNGNPKVIAF